ncbi:MAG: hypothetical protein OXJ37_15230 [Bryobacterales bacterium]|nr:hypothetical protein [Bryobacterales bacterium]MDE0263753.1 hypothetical protein [Bryobacterales bacterium]MDE0620691.1 hypothetical protein [Bryobacterales bacterium]
MSRNSTNRPDEFADGPSIGTYTMIVDDSPATGDLARRLPEEALKRTG